MSVTVAAIAANAGRLVDVAVLLEERDEVVAAPLNQRKKKKLDERDMQLEAETSQSEEMRSLK